jgi:hypothetical protein
MAFGLTLFGASNVFTLSTLGAVSDSPEAHVGVIPGMVNSISSGVFGSMLVTSSHSFPDLSFAAITSSRGSLTTRSHLLLVKQRRISA